MLPLDDRAYLLLCTAFLDMPMHPLSAITNWKNASTRYLSSCAGLKLVMKLDGKHGLPLRIECFTYTNFAGDKQDRKSVSDRIICINRMVVGWHCKKEMAVA